MQKQTATLAGGCLFCVLWFVVQKTKGVFFFRKKGFSERREAVYAVAFANRGKRMQRQAEKTMCGIVFSLRLPS